MQKIIVFSHGFGVRKDDRGLFTDIARHFPDMYSELFDYNLFDEQSNTLIAAPLTAQADKLRDITVQIKKRYSDAIINLVCHSQGCISAALADLDDIHTTVFLAPPAQMLGIEKKDLYVQRPETTADKDGTIRYPRRDGSITIIKDDYWQSREGIMPIDLYNNLSKKTSLTIIEALQDEVLKDTDFSDLTEAIHLLELPSDHDFTGNARLALLKLLETLL